MSCPRCDKPYADLKKAVSAFLTALDEQKRYIPEGADRCQVEIGRASRLNTAREQLDKLVEPRSLSNDRLALWAHLVSEHAGVYGLQLTLEELTDIHKHEHEGPGTIRNHPYESRRAILGKIAKVIGEGEDLDGFHVEE